MRFEILGNRNSDGQKVRCLVDARTSSEAVALASSQGIHAENCSELNPPAHSDSQALASGAGSIEIIAVEESPGDAAAVRFIDPITGEPTASRANAIRRAMVDHRELEQRGADSDSSVEFPADTSTLNSLFRPFRNFWGVVFISLLIFILLLVFGVVLSSMMSVSNPDGRSTQPETKPALDSEASRFQVSIDAHSLSESESKSASMPAAAVEPVGAHEIIGIIEGAEAYCSAASLIIREGGGTIPWDLFTGKSRNLSTAIAEFRSKVPSPGTWHSKRLQDAVTIPRLRRAAMIAAKQALLDPFDFEKCEYMRIIWTDVGMHLQELKQF